MERGGVEDGAGGGEDRAEGGGVGRMANTFSKDINGDWNIFQ